MSVRKVDPEHNGLPSLPESFRTIPIPNGNSVFKRFLAFAGPAYMISVGYMDPGNWATDLEGGARFGYALLWVILISNLIAMLLQTLCLRLGLATGRDLAQACREQYKRPAVVALWLLSEVAIIACDLAEVIGSAVALKLLFGIPLIWGVCCTALDVLLILGLMRHGFRKLEAVVITLVATISVSFAINLLLAHPDWHAAALGLVHPTLPGREALYISLGILGATVMPHNLYLHSSIVQTRASGRTSSGIAQAIRHNTADTLIALSVAFCVNAAILILSAAVFHKAGLVVTELEQAHALLQPLLGRAAATAFAIALLASGQSSTITGTLAGQIVMDGFVQIKTAPWLRRLITRSLAVVPAIIVIMLRGDSGMMELLILSQVVLSMQLPFAIFPLISFTSNKRMMREFSNPLWMKIAGWGCCIAIAILNLYLLIQTLVGRYHSMGLIALSACGLAALLFSSWVKWGCRSTVNQLSLFGD